MIKNVYRAVLPEGTRRSVRRMRERLMAQYHEATWRVLSADGRRRRAEKRLSVGDSFWLFVLGCNNSGTTLLLRVLESHGGIRSLGAEGQKLTRALKTPKELGVRRVWSKRMDYFRMTEEDDSSPVPRILYDWSWRYPAPPGILLEKSPPNTVRSRWIQENFRPSRFIATIRSPYGVCEGMRRREGMSIEDAATHWSMVNRVLWEDMPALEKCLFYRYEDLCANPEDLLSRIEEFLELESPFERSLLLGDELRVHNIEGQPQKLQNMNPKSIARLSPEDIECINSIAGGEMELFGYEKHRP
jgi:hypothetical protein